MSLIPDELVEQVRDSVDLVGLIGESVELKRTGSDWRGPCPFHGGTHRNFAVIPKKGRWYCFVCKEAGDVFSWLMKRYGMDYPTAVRDVARRVGITIPERSERQGPDPREPLYGALASAQDWFHRQLAESAEAAGARDYLAGRGLDLEAVAPFGLGYSPRDNSFRAAMTALGFKPEVLLEAGLLVTRDDGSVAPRFRGRLLFPIHDVRGRVVAFGGRLLGPGEPKYLNSPETPVFHKGSTLYNLHQARMAARKEGAMILVEGYFDVLRLVIAGVDHVVAPLGTALTPDQAALIKRYAPQALLLLDSDTAGLKATFRAADALLRVGVRVKVATMPDGEDPDTLVRAGGAEALEPILRDAVDVLERKIQILERKGWFEGLEHRREALDRLLPTIRAAHDPITRELYLSRVAERTGVDKKVLETEVAAMREWVEPPTARGAGGQGGSGPPQGMAESARPVRPNPGARDEEALLAIALADEGWRRRTVEAARPEWFEVPEMREIFEALTRAPAADLAVIPEGLSPPAQRHWTALLDRAALRHGRGLDQEFATACQLLESRPLVRELQVLQHRLQAATGTEQEALFREKALRIEELNARYPEVIRTQHTRRRLRESPADGRRRS